jgi:hypothetical protein
MSLFLHNSAQITLDQYQKPCIIVPVARQTLRGKLKMTVYIVKSGMMKDFGWDWSNISAFASYDNALKFANATKKQIPEEDLGETEDVIIETMIVME